MSIQGFSSPTGGNTYIVFAPDDQSIVGLKGVKQWMGANIGFKELIGSYKMENGDVVVETSFIINENDRDTVVDAGIIDNQESVLHLGVCNSLTQRPATLLYLDGGEEDLGHMRSVSKEEALKHDAWSLDIPSSTYFICE